MAQYIILTRLVAADIGRIVRPGVGAWEPQELTDGSWALPIAARGDEEPAEHVAGSLWDYPAREVDAAEFVTDE